MRTLLTIFAVSLLAFIAFSFTAEVSYADKPLKLSDEECMILADEIEAVDMLLDCNGEIDFINLGDLIVKAKDPDTGIFNLLNSLIPSFNFESSSQAVTTVAKCGLMSFLVELISEDAVCPPPDEL